MNDAGTIASAIGPYPILRRLAVGGMAEVYLAQNNRSGPKYLALKRVRNEHAGKAYFAKMFRDEVRIVAGLEHPNIARFHDYCFAGETPYYTMEFVNGVTLERLQKAAHHKRYPIPLSCAISIACEAAAALHHAHESTDALGRPRKIVHRDVSPSNILLDGRGRVKLIDFGVAKAAQRESETTSRLLKGRIGYMSPEQCLGGPVDRRSDVFGLGILLYEMTTHQRAYRGSDYRILSQTAERDVAAPSTFVDEYPADLEAIVLRAMKRSRTERYQTALEMLTELYQFAQTHDLSMSPESRRTYLQALIDRPTRRRRRTSRAKTVPLRSPRRTDSDTDTEIAELPLPPMRRA